MILRGHEPGRKLARIARSLAVTQRVWKGDLVRRLHGWRISDVQFLLLCVCHDAPHLSQAELAEAVGISTAQVSGLVEALRRDGWLASHRAAHDRRRQLWELTAGGVERLEQILHSMADGLSNDWSPEAGEALEASLARAQHWLSGASQYRRAA